MGWIHWLAYQEIEGVEVVAICDTDQKRLSGDWTGIKGNFGPAGMHVDLSNVAAYDTWTQCVAMILICWTFVCRPRSILLRSNTA